MRLACSCLVIATACASAPHRPPSAERVWYTLASGGTFDGAPTEARALDVSHAGTHVIILRSGDASGATQGFGLRGADGTFDVTFYRPLPVPAPQHPQRPPPPDVRLVIVHQDGSGSLVTLDRNIAPVRATLDGSGFTIDTPGLGRSRIRLEAEAHATVTGALQGVAAVHAKIGDDTLIAISARGESSDLCVGRYDFAQGHGETIGAHGHGSETFTVQSTVATD